MPPRHTRVAPRHSRTPTEPRANVSSQNRLKWLLGILAITTLLLVAQQLYRLKRHASETSPASVAVAPAAVQDEGSLPVQFDEDGELDLGTMERMLDILYKRPTEMKGYEALDTAPGSYRFRKQADHEGL
ncbi:hypothetical protein MCAP1_001025 [Malassezia caprae]|uniref:Uncharacterized protein n=1 Tax=Malassezia caprae TaxID=1381934 RepID=A0AAF0E5E5_9BASI|nr:hypothetical protein MCAP1_001025 [Malassezia caprae]